MTKPEIAANSSPAQLPTLGQCGKYVDVKYEYDAK